MKSLLISMALLLLGQGLFAQVSITKETYKYYSGTSRYQPANFSGLPVPARGENRMWDYSTLTPSNLNIFSDAFTPGNDPIYFPTANTVRNFSQNALGFQQTGKDYTEVRDDGAYQVGRTFNANTATLGGGAAIVTLPAQAVYQVPSFRKDPFPMQYGTIANSFNTFTTRAFITSPVFGYNNAPVRLVERVTTLDSVIGYGMLRMPGGAMYQVLLRKTVTINVDSFYVNNAPAPAQLLQALGTANGRSSTNVRYRFEAVNNPGPVLSIFTNASNAVIAAAYNITPQACMTPGAISLTDRTESSLALSWLPVNGAVRYQVTFRRKGTVSTSIRIANSNSIVLTGLVPNAIYEVWVQTVCVDGVSASTEVNEFKTRVQACNLNFSSYNISASCDACADGRIEVSPTNGIQPYMYSINEGAWQMSHIFTNLMPGNYNIAVQDNDGCKTMKSVSIPVGACPQPTGLTISEITPTAANVKWNAMGGATRYQVRYRQVGSSQATVLTRTTPMAALSGLTGARAYVVEVRSECGMNGNSTYASRTFVTPSAKLAAENTAMATEIALYPNPARESVNLRYTTPTAGTTNLRVVDLTGRILSQQTVSAGAGLNQFTLDLNNYAEGIYFLQVQQGEVTNMTKLVIK